MTVTAISMSAVPETTGVMTRLSSGSHWARANWTSDDTTMRLTSMGSPPPGAGHEHVPRSQPPDTTRLEGGYDSADCQRREYGPCQEVLALVACSNHDGHEQDRVGQGKNDALEGDPNRQEW